MKEAYRIKGVWLAADTITGVYVIDPIDYPEMESISPINFYNSLKDLSDGEQIFASFDGNAEEIYDNIESEYGIH